MKRYLTNIDAYDKIFLNFPIWWSIPPMAVSTFLEHYEFSGKKIFPFATHEGSGLGGPVSYIKKICPKAEVMEGLAIHGAEANQSSAQVDSECCLAIFSKSLATFFALLYNAHMIFENFPD